MTKPDIAAARVLIVGARGHAGPTLRTVLAAAGISRITIVDEPQRALDTLCSERFTAVFVEGGSELDGMSFAQAARRCPSLLNPMIPIFVVYGGARRRDVERSRDDGVTDVICRPMSSQDRERKIARRAGGAASLHRRAAIFRPRPQGQGTALARRRPAQTDAEKNQSRTGSRIAICGERRALCDRRRCPPSPPPDLQAPCPEKFPARGRPPAQASARSPQIPSGRERPEAARKFAGKERPVPAPGCPSLRSGPCGMSSDTRPIQNMARKIMNTPLSFDSQRTMSSSLCPALKSFVKFETNTRHRSGSLA